MTYATASALFKKEVHHLWPLLLILLALEILGLGHSLYGSAPDEASWLDLSLLFNQAFTTYSAFFYVVGVIAAYLIFQTDREKKTLLFLWSLPVSRSHIVAVKLASAAIVLTFFALISQVSTGLVQLLGQNSIIQSQFGFDIWATELIVIICIQLMGIGTGTLVAYYRMLGVTGFLIIWILFSILAQQFPQFDLILPQMLLATESSGSEIHLPLRSYGLQAAISLICMLLASRLWVQQTDSISADETKSKVAPVIANVLIYGVVCFGIFTYMLMQLFPGSFSQAGGSAHHTLRTGYFEINYLPQDQGQVELLYLEADQLAEQIGKRLGANITTRIAVDLTQTATNHLGIAGWERMKIDRGALLDPSERRHVFVHEAAHVIAASSSNRRLSDHYNYTKFFNEGMAEWVSYELLGLDVQRQALEKLAATAWHRFNLDFGSILYFSDFAAKYDENLVYAIGLVWVDSLAQACGQTAPGLAIKAMSDPEMSQKLVGRQFWRKVLQANKCSLEAVNSRLETRMKQLEPQATTVPQLVAKLSFDATQIQFDIKQRRTTDNTSYGIILRVRENESAAFSEITVRHGTISGTEVSRLIVPWSVGDTASFQYQLGVEFATDQRPFFGNWQNEG